VGRRATAGNRKEMEEVVRHMKPPNLCFMSSSYLGDMVTYENRLLEQPGCETNEHPRFGCTLVLEAGLNNSGDPHACRITVVTSTNANDN